MDETLLRVAEVIATRSTCSRLAVGAVLARDGRVLSTGYNGAPSGLSHCEHYTGLKRSTSELAGGGCKTAVHAEANAIAFAAKHGVRVEGSVLYTTHSPCNTCAFLIINAGVVKVVYGLLYRDFSGLTTLEDAGVVVQSAAEKEPPITELDE